MSSIVKLVGSALNFSSYIAPSFAIKKAFTLFSTPRKGRISDKDIPTIESAFSKELNYQEYSIMTYRWPGKGKTILLVHGWESNTARWDFLLKELKKHDYNIVALDAPAHGNSSGKLFNALLYSEFINVVVNDYKPEIIIGHSVGGMASVFFQSKYQFQQLKKLVLLGAPADFEGVFERYIELLGYNAKIAEGLNNYILKNFNHLPSYFSSAKFSETITCKGLIIHDKKDLVIPYKDALKYQKYFKNSELFTTEGFGHSLKDKVVTEKIEEFLNS